MYFDSYDDDDGVRGGTDDWFICSWLEQIIQSWSGLMMIIIILTTVRTVKYDTCQTI